MRRTRLSGLEVLALGLVAMAVACTQEPTGTLVATWTLRDSEDAPISCERASVPYMRLEATRLSNGAVEGAMTRPCGAPQIGLDVPAGDYVATLYTMIAIDVAGGEWSQQAVSIQVEQTTATAFVVDLHPVVPPLPPDPPDPAVSARY